MRKPLYALFACGFTQFLAGCVVYMPVQCAAPQITDRQQGEVTASTYLNGRVEVAGSYSPVRHLLVHAAYSNLTDNARDSVYYRGHQYDVGVGTYWQLSPRWLVGGLGGVGQAHSEAGFSNGGSLLGFGRPVRHELEARYNKVYGEAYGAFQASPTFSLGAAYRVTHVSFTALSDQRAPVDLSRMTRSEPMFFVRVRLGDGPTNTRPVQLQLAWGSSSTFGYDRAKDDMALGSVAALKQGRGYTTLGISLFPHCLFQKAQPAPAQP